MVRTTVREEKNGKHPYFITPTDMNFAYFVFKRTDGSTFRQYEYDPDTKRWIAHHWHEVMFDEMEQFEVWALYADQYNEIKHWPAFKIKLNPGRLVPVFRYKNYGQARDNDPGKIKLLRRVVLFGIEIPEMDHYRIVWEMDHGFNIKCVR